MRREVASSEEFQRNSISGLAGPNGRMRSPAAEGRNSPDEDVDAMRRVTVEDVNRIAKAYLADQNSIAAALKPVPSGAPVAAKGFGGGEQLTAAPTKPVELPTWAASQLLTLQVPPPATPPAEFTLPNGLRLIVRNEKISPTVTVIGNIRNEQQLETPAGKDGAQGILEDMFSFGTKNLDRLAFQKALDDIAADESGGYDFSLRVLKPDFSRGVELLADNELNPALPEEAFRVIQPQTAQFMAGQLKSPGYRTARARITALYPSGDPALRETTPETVSSLTHDGCSPVLRQNVASRSRNHRGDWRYRARRGACGHRKMVRSVEDSRVQARCGFARRARKQSGCREGSRFQPVAGLWIWCRPSASRDSTPTTIRCK